HAMTEITSSTWGVSRNHHIKGNTIFGSPRAIEHTDWSAFSLTQPVVGDPTKYNANTGWTNCTTNTAHQSGNCFAANYNDRVVDNIMYKTQQDHLFRRFTNAFSNGQINNTQMYPNKN